MIANIRKIFITNEIKIFMYTTILGVKLPCFFLITLLSYFREELSILIMFFKSEQNEQEGRHARDDKIEINLIATIAHPFTSRFKDHSEAIFPRAFSGVHCTRTRARNNFAIFHRRSISVTNLARGPRWGEESF